MQISQTMIVKNEERHIVKALSWGKDIMSEQVVVDTGSEDQTTTLAEEQGAKIYRIFWEDDFSKAKNAAIEHCKGDWIAFLDADEYVREEDVQKLPEIIEKADRKGYDSISASLLELDDEGKVFGGGTLVRFFKNRADIRYHRCIHEQLSNKKEYDATQEITIYHTGYSASEQKRKPSDRNLRLIMEELSRNSKDSEMLGYLGDEYRARDRYREAVESYQKAICYFPANIEESNQRAAVTLERLLQLHVFQLAWQKDPNGKQSDMKRISLQDVETLFQKAIQYFPKEPDYAYLLGEYYFGDGQYKLAAVFYGDALEKLSKYGFQNRALMLLPHIGDTYEKYAFSLLSADHAKEAVEIAVQCVKENHQAMLALKTLLLAFTKAGEDETTVLAILQFLFKIYDREDLHDKMILYYAAGDAHCLQLKKAIMQLFSKEEQQALRDEHV